MSTPPIPPYVGYDWADDLGLEETAEAIRIKADGLADVLLWLDDYANDRLLDLATFADIHRAMFGGLFPQFAGKLRGTAPDVYRNVTFGLVHRGTHADDVVQECTKLFVWVESAIVKLDELQHAMDAEEFSDEVLKVAAYVHCRVVQIHPFVNGNGRTARVCIDYFAARYGFQPVNLPAKGLLRDAYKETVRTFVQGNGSRHFETYVRPYWQYEADNGDPEVPDPNTWSLEEESL